MRLEAGFNTREWKIIAGIELLFHLAQAKNKFAKLTANLQWWSGGVVLDDDDYGWF